MENTEINKVKFFAQYWGQKVFINPVLSPSPVDNTYIFDYSEPEDIDQEYLELKPLSSITDELLLTAIQILDSNNEFTELGSLQIGREIIQIVDNINSEVARNEIHPQYIFHFADYLRSKGYALPWMGLSVKRLEEYGWIKIKK
ncbi:hypothetical protein FY557_17350 [Chryseobacterium sp. SN22]|uniref:hypothetical protein n=1 Tax=Chryseobacterium sp. SN22 TaxID=2606431 RepID=UPI0011EFF201|nr:hypothetical protein [Chryseobacterium sp. SN22]KAA0126417.1 hypothetical protein FY557_17350 [Chryseobacterium sp. SN22]